MNQAQTIRELIRVNDPQAVTLEYGYLINSKGERVLFAEVPHIISSRKSKNGRTLMLLARYPDQSELRFTWSALTGARYTA